MSVETTIAHEQPTKDAPTPDDYIKLGLKTLARQAQYLTAELADATAQCDRSRERQKQALYQLRLALAHQVGIAGAKHPRSRRDSLLARDASIAIGMK